MNGIKYRNFQRSQKQNMRGVASSGKAPGIAASKEKGPTSKGFSPQSK
jgi:hypothetical protein